METKISLLFRILFLSFLFISCQEYKSNKKDEPYIKPPVAMNKGISKFSGNFSGVNNGKEISVTLNSSSSSNRITGILTMDGEQAKITATEKNDSCSGTIIESNSDKTYAISIYFVNDTMNFAITFPEYNNQVLTLVLTKNNGVVAEKKAKNNTELNPKVVGKWRFTEVLSSGSGEFYASFSTDYFLKINSDGTATTWTGSSAGGTNTVIIDGEYSSNVDTARCYTAGNNLVFVNTDTNKEIAIPFYAEENHMILKGNLNRVYTRIN